MWVGSMTLEYVNYIQWAPRTKWEYLWTFHTFKLNLEFWVELYSGHYAHELLFIPIILAQNTNSSQYLFSRIIIHSNTIIENIGTVHNILTIQPDTIDYSYGRQFLPVNVQ